jgi:translation initiation factor IF-3
MTTMTRFANNNQNQNKHRINYQIRSPKVRLIFNNVQMGIISIEDARKFAQEKDLDLVEIAPNAVPPVCYIIDYKKYLYDEKIKNKSKNKKEETKEIRFKSCIEENDLKIKIKQAENFLKKNKKLQLTLKFKSYRDQFHKKKGFELVKRFIKELEEISQVEKEPFVSSDKIFCRLAPKNS